MIDPTVLVLSMNLSELTPHQKSYLHDLKNLAMKMRWCKQLANDQAGELLSSNGGIQHE